MKTIEELFVPQVHVVICNHCESTSFLPTAGYIRLRRCKWCLTDVMPDDVSTVQIAAAEVTEECIVYDERRKCKNCKHFHVVITKYADYNTFDFKCEIDGEKVNTGLAEYANLCSEFVHKETNEND